MEKLSMWMCEYDVIDVNEESDEKDDDVPGEDTH